MGKKKDKIYALEEAAREEQNTAMQEEARKIYNSFHKSQPVEWDSEWKDLHTESLPPDILVNDYEYMELRNGKWKEVGTKLWSYVLRDLLDGLQFRYRLRNPEKTRAIAAERLEMQSKGFNRSLNHFGRSIAPHLDESDPNVPRWPNGYPILKHIPRKHKSGCGCSCG